MHHRGHKIPGTAQVKPGVAAAANSLANLAACWRQCPGAEWARFLHRTGAHVASSASLRLRRSSPARRLARSSSLPARRRKRSEQSVRSRAPRVASHPLIGRAQTAVRIVSIQTSDRNAWFSPQHSTSQEASERRPSRRRRSPAISTSTPTSSAGRCSGPGSRDRGGRVAGDDSFTERESHHSLLFDQRRSVSLGARPAPDIPPRPSHPELPAIGWCEARS